MLTEDSIDWSGLRTAYGSAEDIPALLDRLAGFSPRSPSTDEPWYSPWKHELARVLLVLEPGSYARVLDSIFEA